MAPDKSLAAEIEAVRRKAFEAGARWARREERRAAARSLRRAEDVERLLVRRLRTQHSPAGAVVYIAGIPEAAAEIAALQSRACEDGARKRLADALAAYDAAGRDLTAAEAVHQDICRRMGDEPDIGEIMDRIGAEEACMRCSMAQGIARADLVSAVRAALQPEGERNA